VHVEVVAVARLERDVEASCPRTGTALKRLVTSVIATSVGSRSMLEAPKKPTTPRVRSRT
jgi:hypothetical protein